MDYNQYNNNGQFHQSNSEKPDSFSIASMVCGILSALPCCLGSFSIPLGALGILFAVLTRRKGQKMHSMSYVGLGLSCIGLIFGLVLLIYNFIHLPELLNDPATVSSLNSMSQMLYGMDFDELINTFYGIQMN